MFRICSDHCKHCSNMKLIINVLSFPPCSHSQTARPSGLGTRQTPRRICTTQSRSQTLTRAGRVWAQDYVPPWIMSWGGSVRLYCQKWKATLAYLSIQASTNDDCEVLRRNAETVVQSVLAFEPYVPNGGSLVPHVRVVLDCF